ncbi:hypothetical protein H0B56_00425 [Haloechinothrix sp. YIM 98757]|uniref:Uncharacterized protein n=1 Tax=Haloechinothrix aidingensis TaxID=2752311 RepID=A0A838A5L6_9PSEU|nr:hypothetical protein [Haloechinothrix aidingensis]MBA0124005.1 hypothetical protein [Haloechinothrix aidingensis]
MTEVASAIAKRGMRVRRWCTRALIVLGGTVAGTAAAWTISTASAESASLEQSGHSTVWTVEDDAVESDGDLRDVGEKASSWTRSNLDRVADSLRTGGEPHEESSDAESEDASETDEHGADRGDSTVAGSAESIGSDRVTLRKRGERTQDRLEESLSMTADSIERLLLWQDDAAERFDRLDGSSDLPERFRDWFSPGVDDIADLPGGTSDQAEQSEDAAAVRDTDGDAAEVVDEESGAVRDDATSVIESGADSVPRDDDSVGAGASSALHEVMAHSSESGSAPSSVPATGSIGSAHTVDHTPLTSILGFSKAADVVETHGATDGASRVPFEPGQQPGVTPD